MSLSETRRSDFRVNNYLFGCLLFSDRWICVSYFCISLYTHYMLLLSTSGSMVATLSEAGRVDDVTERIVQMITVAF